MINKTTDYGDLNVDHNTKIFNVVYGTHCLLQTPNDSRWSLGPTPDSMSNCGELIEPPESMTSLFALITCMLLSFMNSTDMARLSTMLTC